MLADNCVNILLETVFQYLSADTIWLQRFPKFVYSGIGLLFLQ